MAKYVLIVSGHHFADSPRKVDLHFLADQLLSEGGRVDFLICRLSLFSRFINDGRYSYTRGRRKNEWISTSERLEQFLWFAPFHPINFRIRWLNALLSPLYRTYGNFLPAAVRARLPTYSHVLIESGPSPMLMRTLRAHATDAKFIYHAADKLDTINTHPCIARELSATLPLYDTIRILAEAMRTDFPANAPVMFLPHGISKEMFDAPLRSPYKQPQQAVSVGDMMFDANVIDLLATANPDWTFHLFGKKALPLIVHDNIIVHGEVAFETLVPYIKFANIGLAPYVDGIGADYLSQSSLKMIQYSYCQLPIVAPHFAAAGRSHVFAYQPGDARSIKQAFNRAKQMKERSIDTSTIQTWKEVSNTLFGDVIAPEQK